MVNFIQNILTIVFLLSVSQAHAEQIWYEPFSVPDKGIWGSEDGVAIYSDFSGITNWFLEYETLLLTSPDDYAKTVPTSGGRFEVRDIDGVVTWRSEWINTNGFYNISVSLTAYETGSGANEANKYLKAFFRLDGGDEILFGTNGINAGNWGDAHVGQQGLNCDSLQIVVYMANHYSSDKVTLDEVLVTGETSDSTPPFITDVKVWSADTLAVYFNEPVDPETVSRENFSLFSGTSEFPVLSISEIFNNFLFLIISPSGIPSLTLNVSGVSDLAGNTTVQDTFPFSYFPPVQLYDVVINEIMADPYPPLGLPESEYIELFNRAGYPVLLENWSLGVDETEKFLDALVLLPDCFLVLSPTGASDLLAFFGRVSGVPGFPSLRNSGASLKLLSQEGIVVDEIDYSDDWPFISGQSDGGRSLERIDPNRFCGQAYNWEYSENELGGTPGFQNSVKAENPDSEPPWVLKVEAVSPNQLEITFSERMDTFLLKNVQNFIADEGLDSPDFIETTFSEQIKLNFTDTFSEDKIYTLAISALTDECGNSLDENTFTFTWSVARPGDIVINEVLSNPYSEGTDFVEFYNNSEKNLYLDHLQCSNGKDTIRLVPSNNDEIILGGGGYIVCAKDSAKVVLPYFSSCPENIFQVSGFPNIYNDEGTVVLLNEENQVVDQFFYSKSMYSPVLSEIGGISLERISSDSETQNPVNWHSAAETVGFATPGCKNSQAVEGNIFSVTFEPESFSPNLDGYNDEYRIKYQLNQAGYIANVWVFDASGRQILQLAKNELLATEGWLTWNGEDETGQKLPLGVYIVLLELFDTGGNIYHYKDAVVLTDILE